MFLNRGSNWAKEKKRKKSLLFNFYSCLCESQCNLFRFSHDKTSFTWSLWGNVERLGQVTFHLSFPLVESSVPTVSWLCDVGNSTGLLGVPNRSQDRGAWCPISTPW